MKKLLLFYCLLICVQLNAQESLLQSGPMVGYSTMKEVMLWVQTKEAAEVQFIYFEKDKPALKFKTEIVKTEPKNAFTVQTIAQVQPGKRYSYELYINKKNVKRPYPLEFQSQTLWQYRTEPPNFKFVYGSCTYVNEPEVDRPGNPYGGDYQIFTAVYQQKPDFMLWGGDNTYLREVDFDSRTGILHRYTHTRSLAEIQPLLGSTHNYALWDDHEFGPNDSDRSYPMKKTTLEAFKLFWTNPNYIFNEGITGSFMWQDVQFFLLDDRYHRSSIDAKTAPKEMLGEMQIRWLIDALKVSRAPFKFVATGGQVLNTDTSPFLENYIRFREERQKLLNLIQEEGITGVIFLTGDRHHAEISKMERENSYPLYEFTVSPFTAGATGDRAKDEKNQYREANTHYGKRNFGVFEVTGTRTDRILTVQLCDTDGKEIWKKTIKANELRNPKKEGNE